MTEEQITKRELLKRAAYIAPALLTLKAVSSFASSGSCQAELERRNDKRRGNNGVGNGLDPQPPGNPRSNDGPGTGPGNPGNKHNHSRR